MVNQGKKPDKQGKVCSYSHPPICKKHEMQGKCMNHRCKKLHLNVCRRFMENQQCDYGENCRLFHPKGMKEHGKNVHEENKFLKPNVSYSYAQAVKNTTSPFLEQNPHIQQPVIGHPNQFQNQFQKPFLVQQSTLDQRSNTNQVFLDLQNGQKHMMQMFMTLNQKLMNLEKYNLQMQKL